MLPTLSNHLGNKEPEPSPSQLICTALLSITFKCYFPNASDRRIAKEFANVREKSSMSVHEEHQLIEIANDGRVKSMFQTSSCAGFWIKTKTTYSKIAA